MTNKLRIGKIGLRLVPCFVPQFEKMKSEHGARRFRFRLAPATSFLRVHKPEQFGDDLSSFRLTVAEVNTNGRPISALEREVAGLGMRGVVPVEYNGQQIDAMPSTTGGAADAVASISKRMQQIGEVIASIASAVEERSAAAQEIARNAQETASGTSILFSGIAQVRRDAGEFSAGVDRAAAELNGQTEEPHGEVLGLLGKIRAA